MQRIYLETFGCQMNELDSELVTGQLRQLGYTFTPDAAAAEVVLYNTCSVREHAEQKVWSRLGELAIRKRAEPGLVVGVLGCMAEREGEALFKRMPVVDLMCGPGELDRLPGLLDNAVRTRRAMLDTDHPDHAHGARRSARQAALQGNANRRSSTLAASADNLELLDLARATAPDERRGSAYVRITRGCNKFCSYCVVPFTRGAEVHRPPDHIVDECKRLVDAGVVEITLLGQTVNHYRFEHGAAVSVGGVVQPQKGRPYALRNGVYEDPYKAEEGRAGPGFRVTTFADLLARIHDEVPGLRRLRFVTSFPRSFGDDVLRVIRDHPRICRYLHVPAQSGSNRILGLMNRGYTVEEYLDFLGRARAHLHQPEIGRPLTIAGDIIVGFPTETQEDYEATRALLEKARYKNCFIFKYSPRPGTIAIDKLEDDVPDAVKRQRNNDLLALQNRLCAEVAAEFVGQSTEVLVEGVSRRESKRTAMVSVGRGSESAAGSGIGLTIGGKPLRGNDPAPAACGDGSTACCESTHLHTGAGGSGPVQLSGRTEGDMIVFFDVPGGSDPKGWIGRVVRTRIRESGPLALFGEVI